MSKKIMYRDIKQLRNKQPAEYTPIEEQKELSPLEALKRIRQETIPATYNQDFDKEECCKIIETALKRLEKYDNSHLVALPRMSGKNSLMNDYIKAYDILQIIKTKNVNIQLFKAYKNNLKFYNMDMPEDRQLTEEEFNLLIEVLK